MQSEQYDSANIDLYRYTAVKWSLSENEIDKIALKNTGICSILIDLLDTVHPAGHFCIDVKCNKLISGVIH